VNKIIQNLIKSLNSIEYKDKHGNKYSFEEYLKTKDFFRKGDEDRYVSPIIRKLFEFLDYTIGKNIIEQELKAGNKPDFKTAHTNLFILDCKSSNVSLFSVENQIKQYLEELKGYKYGILFNLRYFEFYKRIYQDKKIIIKHLDDKTIDLIEVYQNKTESNSYKNFLWFIENFKYSEISEDKYLDIVKKRQYEDLVQPDQEDLLESIRNLLDKVKIFIRNETERIIKDYEPEMKYFLHAGTLYIQLQEIFKKIESEIKINEDEINRKDEIILDEFVMQASYVAIIKIILLRIFEDNDLIDKNLYNGGLKEKTAPPFNYTLSKILKTSIDEGRNYYSYFFNSEVFHFSITDDDLIVHLLYELTKYNFKELNFDIIGSIYEHYLDRAERKNKGVYYTPHFIVELILNRVGFTGEYLQKDKVVEKMEIYDPACGSGGFLVEATRRMLNFALKRKEYPFHGILLFIIRNIFGSEISGFSAFLTEINIIIQIIPLLKLIDKLEAKRIDVLKIFKEDSLLTFYERTAEQKKNFKVYTDHRTSLKDYATIEFIKQNDMLYIVGNPPYIGEDEHKELFYPLKEHPYWKNYYTGKSNYLYYFIILGITKLREGGTFSFITTQNWITADGATKLRQYILDTCKILEIIDFQGIKLFKEAPGQENIVFVLEKCEDIEERENNKIRMICFKSDWCKKNDKIFKKILTDNNEFERLIKTKDNEEFRVKGFSEHEYHNKKFPKRIEIADIYYSAVLQGELDNNAWYIYKKEKDKIKYGENVVPISEFCNINQGVVPAPITIGDNISFLTEEAIKKHNITKNSGVFVLSKDEYESLKLTDREKKIIKKFYKNSNIKKGYIDFNDFEYLIYSSRETVKNIDDFPAIKFHLKKFYDFLNKRQEKYKENYEWYVLNRPREEKIFTSEKIAIPYRASDTNFTYTNKEFFSASDTYLITKKEEINISLKYIYSILISNQILDWLDKNCKKKGKMFEFFPTPLKKIPIYSIDLNNENEKKIYYILSGDYKLEKQKEYKYDELTNTYIKQKGLVDYYLSLKNELNQYLHNGFIFNSETPISQKSEIKADYQKVYNNYKLQYKTLSKFRLKDLIIYSNEIEKFIKQNDWESVKNKIGDKTLYIITNKELFFIKKIESDQPRLIKEEIKLKKFGFIGRINLTCTDYENKDFILNIEYKDSNLIDYIREKLQSNKKLKWTELLEEEFYNNELFNIIEKEKAKIYEILKPLENKKELDLMIKNNKLNEEILKNLNTIQYLLDGFINKLYDNTTSK